MHAYSSSSDVFERGITVFKLRPRQWFGAAVLAITVVLSGFAPTALATSTTVTTACSTGDTCFYPQTNTNGSVVAIPNGGSHGFWFNLCTVTGECQPLSVWENGNSCVWLYTNSTRANEHLIVGQVDQNTNDRYDWAFIKYGTDQCDTIPKPLP